MKLAAYSLFFLGSISGAVGIVFIVFYVSRSPNRFLQPTDLLVLGILLLIACAICYFIFYKLGKKAAIW
jgi:multisubunit Na+/H+ antiporter MnhB subunit